MSASVAPGFDAYRTVLLDELPDGVFVTDARGVILYSNDAFLDMLQRSGREVWGKPMSSFVASEDILAIIGFESVFADPQVQDASVIFALPCGTSMSVLLSSRRAGSGGTVTLSARSCGSLYRELSDTSRWAALEQERAAEIGAARDELATKNDALERAREEVQSAYTKLQAESEARARLEGELRLAHKLEAIGQLAAGVAHEINTPMQYIGDNLSFLQKGFEALVGYTEQIERNIECSEGSDAETMKAELKKQRRRARVDFLLLEIPRALKESLGGVEHVSSIVRAMKSFTHVDHGEKTMADVNQAIRDSVAVSQNEYKSIAKVALELEELPPLRCFVGQLSQVFVNLIVNAAHAIEDASRDELGTITIRSRSNGEAIEIDFEDTGCGIPEDIRDRVYEQFFTTKSIGKGTGQGLALARNVIVEAHQGTISLQSEVGVGTTFTIRLPVATPSIPT